MKALIVIAVLGVIAMLSEIFSFKKLLYPIVLIGLLSAAVLAYLDWNVNEQIPLFKNMLVFDNFAGAFTIVLSITGFLWFMMSHSTFSDESSLTDHYALALFSIAGGVVMVSFGNMTMLFLGIEILSIPLYVLAGSRKTDTASNEAAFKYFLMGAFASGFLLFGIALIYGATGTFDIREIAVIVGEHSNALPGFFIAGVLMLLAGMAFKVSAVPFHFWAPDVYQGSPTQVTAFMATIVKTAAFAAFFRLFSTCFSTVAPHWASIVWVMAALTLMLGNVTAVYQRSAKRMLAYSSIAHAGYMMLAILAMNQFSSGSVLYYTASYSVSTIASFTVLLTVITATGSDLTDSFNGLARKNGLLAVAMTIALLSLAGIPVTAGFFAKYYIFTSAMESGYIWLVIVAVIASLVGVYYYFRIIINMFFKESADSNPVTLEASHKLLLIITCLLILALGLFPDLITRHLI